MATTLFLFMMYGGSEVSGAGTWWTIVGGMATFIMGQFAWNKKLSGDLKSCQDARISSLEEKLRMTQAAKDPDAPAPAKP